MAYDRKAHKWIEKFENDHLLHNPDAILIQFDMNVTINLDPATDTVSMTGTQIDLDSVSVDPNVVNPVVAAVGKYIPFFNLGDKVLDGVVQQTKAVLTSTNAGLAKAPVSLMNPLTIPSSIVGIPIKIQEIQGDPSGSFMVYTTYGEKE